MGLAGSIANESISGNLSQGNMSYANLNGFNSSMNKLDNSASFKYGGSSMLQESGSLATVTGDGTRVITAGKGFTNSSFGSDVSYSNMLTSQANQSISHLETENSSLVTSSGETLSAMATNMTSLTERNNEGDYVRNESSLANDTALNDARKYS